jgi:hypothetical protein
MIYRRPIQQAHERFFVEQFINWFNSAYRSNFKVILEPNQPEAIIRSSRTTRWVEVSTAFWNSAYARDLYSYATPNEIHKPIGPGPFLNMDHEFAKSFASVIKKKFEKTSYLEWRDRYGPGYLIIPIKHPWFDKVTIMLMKEALAFCSINNLGCFRRVYIAFSSINRIKFLRWSLKTT